MKSLFEDLEKLARQVSKMQFYMICFCLSFHAIIVCLLVWEGLDFPALLLNSYLVWFFMTNRDNTKKRPKPQINL